MIRFLCIFVLFMLTSLSTNGNTVSSKSSEEMDELERNLNSMLDFACKNVNLIIGALVDVESKSITVLFELSDSRYKNCFKYFEVFLVNEKGHRSKMIRFNDYKKMTYEFKNVSCGSYRVYIVPCYDTDCTTIHINYTKHVNISGGDCLLFNSSAEIVLTLNTDFKIYLSIGLLFILLISLSGVFYCYYKSNKYRVRLRREEITDTCSNRNNPCENVIDHETILVFLLHYYNDEILSKVECLKQFLSECSIFNVIQIEDKLPEISMYHRNGLDSLNPNMNLKYDPWNNKVIIVASVLIENETENEVENRVFYEIIEELKKYSDNRRSGKNVPKRFDYDNLFIVHFDSSLVDSEEFAGLVDSQRFYIPDHLENLCLCLISKTSSDTPSVREKIKKLLSDHPIRNLCFK